MKRKKDASAKETLPAAPFHNPFGVLAAKRDSLAPGPPRKAEPAAKATLARAVVRLERKGRGGKEVTVVEQLELKPRELELWLKALKQSLGCGGVLEESALVVQGDQRERVEGWLKSRGVRKVVSG